MCKKVNLNGIALLAFISFLAISLITLFKNALELEDAEQAYYSQWLRWGYDDQPPLYTWMQYVFNQVFGENKISFSIFRGLLFAGTLFVLHRFALVRIKDLDKSKLAVLIVVLVPVFIDFTFRRLSHTSLLCLCIIATYYCIQQLVRNKSYLNYVLLGLLVGIGILSKYNYIFFLITLFLVSIWDKKLRVAIWNLKIIISIVIASICVFPHVYWLIGPSGYQSFLTESVQTKVMGNEVIEGFSIMPLVTYLKGFSALLYLIFIATIASFFLKHIRFEKPVFNWFFKMFITQLIVLVLFFIIFQTQKVETRWLLPLFLPFTILLMETVDFKNSKQFVKIGFWTFYVVIFVQTVRTPVEKLLKIKSSVQYSFYPIADKLKITYDDYQWVLPNVTYAGNIRLLHPERMIISQDDYSFLKGDSKLKKEINVSLIIPLQSNHKVVDSIIGFGKEKEDLYFHIDLRN